jgi:RimJ/RimL family protein N-acetyltransferase
VATHAVVLLRDWAHAAIGLERLVMRIHPDNAASRRVAERATFRLAHRAPDGLLTFTHRARD